MQYDKLDEALNMTSDQIWSWYNELPENERYRFEQLMKKRKAKITPTAIKILKMIDDELSCFLDENNLLRSKLGISETQLIRR